MEELISNEFLPHGYCLVWQPELVLLHIISDGLITLSYYSIPIALAYFVATRKDLAYDWVFKLFGAFIFACGTTHLISIVTLWEPAYWIEGGIKAATAGVSLVTAILLWPLIPKALALPSPTDLNKTNQELERQIVERRQAQEKFRGLLESAPDAMVIVDRKGEIVLINAQTEKLFGYKREELLGQSVDLLLPKRFQDGHAASREHYFTNPHPRPMGVGLELYGRRKNGSEFPVEISLSPLETEDGLLVSSAIRDITDRKQAEAALRRAKDELEQRVVERTAELARQTTILQCIIDNISEGLIVANEEGQFLVFNPAAEQILGLGKLDIMPDEWSEQYGIFYPDTITPTPPAELPLARAIQGKAADEIELFIRNAKRPDGIFISANGRPLKDERDQLMGGVVVFRDITRRKQSEQELRRLNEELIGSNKELEQFAYVASHDLQEPLRTVTNYVQLLTRKYQGHLDEKADKYIGYIVDGADRMSALIQDLLTYSRVNARVQNIEPTDSQATLRRTLDNLKVTIKEADAVVTHDSLPTLMATGSLLGQVFQNLISNAIKFRSEKPPCIHISVRQKANEWIFCIEDNGIGIDPEFAERIFVIFQRLHTRREYPGTGIGLAVCKKIVESHGGRIWVESQPGRGSKFYFTWPIQRE